MNIDVIARQRLGKRQKIRLTILFLMVITFPVLMNYFSVFLIIEGSAKGIMTFSFFFWTAWIVLSLIFGRAACGYLCPLGAFQETKDRMASKTLKKIKGLKFVKLQANDWRQLILATSRLRNSFSKNLLY